MKQNRTYPVDLDYSVELERAFVAYADLWHSANVLHERAIEVEKGRTHIIRAALVFRAFAFESYLLHIWARFFPEEADYPKKSVKDKLIYLNNKYSMGANFGIRPFQTITILFDKRNKLAHSKDVDLFASYKTKYGKGANKYYENELKTDIENYCILDNMLKAKEDAQKCAEIIAEKVGLPMVELFRMGFSTGSISVAISKSQS